nr:hypothetical protein FVER53263_03493 [Fusarium verticillioides]
MSNSPQILGQVTNGVSLQPSRAGAPADSPTVASERPSLSFPRPCIRAGMEDSWILKNAKVTKTDDKTSLNSSGTDRDSFMKSTDVDPNWDEVIPADKLAETKAKREEKQHNYAISQDHTSGKESHKDNLLASFGKRQRPDNASISLGGSRLFHRSTNMLANLSSGDDVVAQNEGSDIDESSIDHVNVFDFLVSLGSHQAQRPPSIAAQLVHLEAQFRTKNPTLPPNQIRQMATEHLTRLMVAQRTAMNSAAQCGLAASIATTTSPHQYAMPSTQKQWSSMASHGDARNTEPFEATSSNSVNKAEVAKL